VCVSLSLSLFLCITEHVCVRVCVYVCVCVCVCITGHVVDTSDLRDIQEFAKSRPRSLDVLICLAVEILKSQLARRSTV